jgi:hypothetical protein
VALRPASRDRKHSSGRAGTSITYTDSQAALTRFTILRIEPGVKRGAYRCLKPRSRAPVPRSRRCKRYVFIGAFSRRDRAGRNTRRFSGLVNGRDLEPAYYRLEAVPSFEYRTGPPADATFRIVTESELRRLTKGR